MNWKSPWKKKATAEAPGGADSSPADDLEAAAADTEAPAAAASLPRKEEVTASADLPHEALHGLPLEVGEIGVRLCFYPLARFNHPAWMPTSEEIEPIAPKMVVLVEALLDRALPQVLTRFLNKYPEAAPVVLGMASLGYVRFKAVRAVLLEEAKERNAQIRREAEAGVQTIQPQPENRDKPPVPVA